MYCFFIKMMFRLQLCVFYSCCCLFWPGLDKEILDKKDEVCEEPLPFAQLNYLPLPQTHQAGFQREQVSKNHCK